MYLVIRMVKKIKTYGSKIHMVTRIDDSYESYRLKILMFLKKILRISSSSTTNNHPISSYPVEQRIMYITRYNKCSKKETKEANENNLH